MLLYSFQALSLPCLALHFEGAVSHQEAYLINASSSNLIAMGSHHEHRRSLTLLLFVVVVVFGISTARAQFNRGPFINDVPKILEFDISSMN